MLYRNLSCTHKFPPGLGVSLLEMFQKFQTLSGKLNATILFLLKTGGFFAASQP